MPCSGSGDLMDEFTFLHRMFRRLSEAEGLRAWDEQTLQPLKVGKKMVKPHSAFETAGLMIEYSIRDYLSLKHEAGNDA